MITMKRVSFSPDSPDIDAEVYWDMDRPFGHKDLFKGGPMWLSIRNKFRDIDQEVKSDFNYFLWPQHVEESLKALDIMVSDDIIIMDDDDYCIEEVDI